MNIENIKNEFITVKGVKLFCLGLIDGLDDYRYDITRRNDKISKKYNRMICPLQDVIDEWYTEGLVEVPDYTVKFILEGYDMPKSTKILEVVDEMLDQLVDKLCINLNDLLKTCKDASNRDYKYYLE